MNQVVNLRFEQQKLDIRGPVLYRVGDELVEAEEVHLRADAPNHIKVRATLVVLHRRVAEELARAIDNMIMYGDPLAVQKAVSL